MNFISKTTTFGDIFKSSYTDNITSFSVVDTIIALALAFAIGIFIYFVYKKTFNGVMYSSSFGVSLIAMTLITTFVILAVTSNVVLSLGMVGALSIVRFRTAIKDPLDVGFLFWSVAVGITCGAGLYIISLAASVGIALVYILLVKVRNRKRVYLLIIKYKNDAYDKVVRTIQPLKKVLKNRMTANDVPALLDEEVPQQLLVSAFRKYSK
ncbi:MAG: DUF4956 domain-containing protein [Lachnospiraceae bacterium]|nr:DUF4956 domain-containing protein [Lachnospiraceae bacterium]